MLGEVLHLALRQDELYSSELLHLLLHSRLSETQIGQQGHQVTSVAFVRQALWVLLRELDQLFW